MKRRSAMHANFAEKDVHRDDLAEYDAGEAISLNSTIGSLALPGVIKMS